MARTTTTGSNGSGKAAAARKTARKRAASTTTTARRSSEIVPRRAALAQTAQRLKSPKVFVPLAVALGIGVAAVRKLAGAASARGPRALPRMAKEISPRFAEAVRALADLGRELRTKIR